MASYDLLIIGAGPAAWSCAMTARQRGLTTAVACAQSATSWLQRAERIDNYPGLPQISGKELLSRFRAQAADMGVVIIEQLARQIMPNGDIYMTLVGNDIIESRAIVLAMGAARPKLLPGEEELLGARRKLVRHMRRHVLPRQESGGAVGMDGRHRRSGISRRTGIRGGLLPAGAARAAGKSAVPPVRGQAAVHPARRNQLVLVTDAGEYRYDGIFIFRPAVSPDTLLPGLKTEGAFIPVDRRMATNLPRVYACGDCTGQPLQIAKAVGEGNVAAISASADLSRGARA